MFLVHDSVQHAEPMMKTRAVAHDSISNTTAENKVSSLDFLFPVISNVVTTRRMDTGGSTGPTASVGIARVLHLSLFGFSRKQRRFHINVCTTTLKRYLCFVFTKSHHLLPMSSSTRGGVQGPRAELGASGWVHGLDRAGRGNAQAHPRRVSSRVNVSENSLQVLFLNVSGSV